MHLEDDWDDETAEDTLAVLHDLAEWRLTPTRWERVEHLLERIGTALQADDVEELREAMSELDLSAPVRILRIGSVHETGIPATVLDRRNELVHRLTRPQPSEEDRGSRRPR